MPQPEPGAGGRLSQGSARPQLPLAAQRITETEMARLFGGRARRDLGASVAARRPARSGARWLGSCCFTFQWSPAGAGLQRRPGGARGGEMGLFLTLIIGVCRRLAGEHPDEDQCTDGDPGQRRRRHHRVVLGTAVANALNAPHGELVRGSLPFSAPRCSSGFCGAGRLQPVRFRALGWSHVKRLDRYDCCARVRDVGCLGGLLFAQGPRLRPSCR